MGNLIRFGVSMEKQLAQQLDQLITQGGYPSRSEAIRALIRAKTAETHSTAETASAAGIITLTYRYGTLLARSELHEYPSLHILSNVQVHLKKQVVMKVIIVSGQVKQINQWAARLMGQKGVEGSLTITATHYMAEP